MANILQERNARRTTALVACVAEVSASRGFQAVTHEVVAERCGLPVQYVRWKYPSQRHLLGLLDSRAAALAVGA